jgi:hypothetical protein
MVSPGDGLTVGQSSSYMKRNSTHVHQLAVEAFDELSSSSSASKQLDVAALKYMTSGSLGSSNLMFMCCNLSNLPDLRTLSMTDPACFNRFCMLLDRAMFNSPPPGNLHTRIERLLPALCKLLLQEHTMYLQ